MVDSSHRAMAESAFCHVVHWLGAVLTYQTYREMAVTICPYREMAVTICPHRGGVVGGTKKRAGVSLPVLYP